jgi:hypothetical protein
MNSYRKTIEMFYYNTLEIGISWFRYFDDSLLRFKATEMKEKQTKSHI